MSTATAQRKRPPRRSGSWQHFGLLLTDAVLFHPRLSHAAKLVLAATLAYPNRNPSLTQLEQATGLRRKTIIDAQNELEREEIALYDRPRHPWDREPSHPRFQRSNRLTWVAREADPYDSANTKKRVELPGAIATKLPRGKKNNAHFPLVALFYAREQLIRGAIHVENKVVAKFLRLNERQIERMRQEMRQLGLLVFARRETPADIFTFPGATAREPDPFPPTGLDVTKTRRFVPLHTACFPQPTLLLATGAERQHVDRTTRRLGPHLTAAALTNLFQRDFDAVYREGEEELPERPPLTAADLLDELAAVERDLPAILAFHDATDEVCDDAHEPTEVRRSGTLSPTVREPGLLPPTSREIKTYGPAEARLADGPDETRFAREALTSQGADGSRPHDEQDGPEGHAAAEKGVGEEEESKVDGRREAQPELGPQRASPAPRLDAVSHWPPGVAVRACEVFGARAVTAGSTTNKRLEQSISHALRVWGELFGGTAADGETYELSPEQEAFAGERLVAALDYLKGRPTARDRYAAIKQAFVYVVNHEQTHAAFKERPWTPSDEEADGRTDASPEIEAILSDLLSD